ncbi:unnamed protein product [Arabis nemorensis]|uniref:aminocyclopropanecarboxylate oxidase n=1 Tax=Arabis nemorensis TaxID=586526 RepID=A0A565B1P7_9BRAS|nr:unnamed protein product [Arabis nemorensis]
MREYREEVRKLASKMMEVMDENLGLPKGYMKKAFNEGMGDGEETAFFGTKVSHYPPCPHPELVSGLRAHTDAGGVVLLFQDDEYDGLQVLKDGEWIDVQPLPNAIVINTGDQIEVLSNGRYKSAWHRVLAREEGNRRSIASFYNPSYKAAIGPAEVAATAAEEGSEKKYPKFVFGDYMDVYANQKFMAKEPRFLAVKREACSFILLDKPLDEPFELEIWITPKIEEATKEISWSKLFTVAAVLDVNIPIEPIFRSFLIDEVKKVALLVDQAVGHDAITMIGYSGSVTVVDLGKPAHAKASNPLLMCPYVPSSVQIKQPARRRHHRKRQGSLENSRCSV